MIFLIDVSFPIVCFFKFPAVHFPRGGFIFPGLVVSASEQPELPVPGAIHPSELFRRGKEEPGEAAETVQGKMCFHRRKYQFFSSLKLGNNAFENVDDGRNSASPVM